MKAYNHLNHSVGLTITVMIIIPLQGMGSSSTHVIGKIGNVNTLMVKLWLIKNIFMAMMINQIQITVLLTCSSSIILFTQWNGVFIAEWNSFAISGFEDSSVWRFSSIFLLNSVQIFCDSLQHGLLIDWGEGSCGKVGSVSDWRASGHQFKPRLAIIGSDRFTAIPDASPSHNSPSEGTTTLIKV